MELNKMATVKCFYQYLRTFESEVRCFNIFYIQYNELYSNFMFIARNCSPVRFKIILIKLLTDFYGL